jgi:hypothetical protein
MEATLSSPVRGMDPDMADLAVESSSPNPKTGLTGPPGLPAPSLYVSKRTAVLPLSPPPSLSRMLPSDPVTPSVTVASSPPSPGDPNVTPLGTAGAAAPSSYVSALSAVLPLSPPSAPASDDSRGTKSKGRRKRQSKNPRSKPSENAHQDEKGGDSPTMPDPQSKPKRKPRFKKPVTTPDANADDDSNPEDDASFREHRIRIGQKKTDFLLAFEQRYKRAKKAKKPKVAVGNLFTAAAGEFIAEFGHLVFTGSQFTPSDVGADLKGTLENSGLDTDAIRAIKDNRDECLEETRYVRLPSFKAYLSHVVDSGSASSFAMLSPGRQSEQRRSLASFRT